MNSWRGAIVLLAAGLAGSAGTLAWLFTLQNEWMPLRRGLTKDQEGWIYFLSMAEGLSLMLGPAFGAGRFVARVLIHRQAADEIARSGRWRMIPLNLATGILLILTRFLVFPQSQLWSGSHILAMVVGGVLVTLAVGEAWVHWIAPWRSRAATPPGL